MNDKMRAYGQKVQIRSMELKDVESMIGWGIHREDLFNDYNFPYMDEEEREYWFEFKTRGRKRCFSVFNQEGSLVGYISLRKVHAFLKQSEMGIVFNPDKINQGYGTDAMKTFIRWYFSELKYRKLILHVAAYNKRAIKAYEKAGFRKVSQNYGEFMNDTIDPLREERYQTIRPFFRKKWKGFRVLQYKMEISTLSTG